MELIDLVESSDRQHPSVAEIRVEVAGDSESHQSDGSFKLSADQQSAYSQLQVVSLVPKPRTEMTFGDLKDQQTSNKQTKESAQSNQED